MRTCDRCGAKRPGNAFRVISKRWICNWHDHYVASEELEKIPIQTFPVKPFKDAKPFEPRDTYERAEWEILNYVTGSYRTDFDTIANYSIVKGNVNGSFGSSGVFGAAWTCIYLYELIAENRRPATMITIARAKLREIADWLLTRQWGAPHLGSVGTYGAEMGWGGYSQFGEQLVTTDMTFTSIHSIYAGMAMLRAYQIHGDSRYLESARATAWFVRTTQSSGKHALFFTSSDVGGADRMEIPGVVSALVYTGGFSAQSSAYSLAGGIGLEFLFLYGTIVGDEVIGSSDTAGAYSISRAATVSAALAEMLAFYKTGVMDFVRNGVYTGLSSTTPFLQYSARPDLAGTWTYTTTVDGESAVSGVGFALALRGVRAVEGDTAFVTTIFDWLMTFGSNPANQFAAETPLRMESGTSVKDKQASIKGTYDPTLSWATSLSVFNNVGAAVKYEALSTIHAFQTVGLLAGLWSTRQPAQFRELKQALNEPRSWTERGDQDGRHFFLGPMGRSGLNLQPRNTATTGFNIVGEAAITGLIYRQDPPGRRPHRWRSSAPGHARAGAPCATGH
jgi:hypothetical protein